MLKRISIAFSIILVIILIIVNNEKSLVLKVEFEEVPSRVSSINSPGQIYGVLFSQIYETLFYLKPSGTLVPQLVKSWSANKEYSKFDFKLKQNVLFHNGIELTADDVISSLNYIKSNLPDSNFSQILNKIESINKISKFEFEIKLNEADYEFLYFLAAPISKILPIKGSKSNKTYEEEWIGTGAFKFKNLDKERIVLTKFSKYRESLKLDEVDFVLSFEPVKDLVSKKIDIAYIPRRKVEAYRADKNFKVISSPMLGSFWLGFNMQQKPMSNLKVREFIFHLLDRSKVIDGVIIKKDMIPRSIVPYGILGYEASRIDFNEGTSKRIYKNLKKITSIKLLTPSKLHKMGHFVIAQLRKKLEQFNIKLIVKKVPLLWAEKGNIGNYYRYLRRNPNEFDLYLRGMVSPLASAEKILKETFSKNGMMNLGNYSSEKFELLLKNKPNNFLESDIENYISKLTNVLEEDFVILPLGTLFSNKLLRFDSKLKLNGMTPYVLLFKDVI